MKRAKKEPLLLKVTIHHLNAPDWRERYYRALQAVVPELRGEKPPEREEDESLKED